MSLYFRVLAGGSKGNAVLVCSPTTHLLLDAGLSAKELSRRLDRTPVKLERLDAVLVSHEHQDHVRGVGVLSRRLNIPVHLTRGTADHLPSQVGRPAHLTVIEAGVPFEVGDIVCRPFAVSHDASEPVGFVFEHNGTKLGFCTDLGVATNLVKARLQGCHGLIIEANHDPERLMNGPYPPHLKQRIRSRHGHLSNADAMNLLEELHHAGLRNVILTHLSEVNNHPDLVAAAVEELCSSPRWEGVRFDIAVQHDITEGFDIG